LLKKRNKAGPKTFFKKREGKVSGTKEASEGLGEVVGKKG